MKTLKKIGLLSLGFFFLVSSTLLESIEGDGAFDARVNTVKQECKDMISTTRYEGSKITYYNVKPSKQTKSVELFLFLAKEYEFVISGKLSSTSLNVKIYDAASDVEERTMIKEFKGVKGKNIVFNSKDLNKIYRKKVPEVERLKNVHVEYTIGSGDTVKEAIVLVYGHRP